MEFHTVFCDNCSPGVAPLEFMMKNVISKKKVISNGYKMGPLKFEEKQESKTCFAGFPIIEDTVKLMIK